MDLVEPVVFGPVVDGLRKALGKQLTPEVKQRVLAVGIDFERSQVAYPAGAFLSALEIVGEALASEFPVETRFVQLGRLFMRGFVETGMGLAALTAARVLGVRRTLLRMGRNFKTGSNYLETAFTEVGPKELVLHTWVPPELRAKLTGNGKAIIDYRRGILEEVLALLHANGSVEVMALDTVSLDATFRITWA